PVLATVDWLSFATGIAAVATLVLAIATWKLVSFTKEEAEAVRRQAEASERQAEMSAEAIASATRPWLTSVSGPVGAESTNASPVSLSDGVERLHQIGIEGHVAVRNAGQGLAVIPRDSSFVWGREGESREFTVSRNAFPRSSILAPGESTRLEFFVADVPFDNFVGSTVGYDFFMHVLYTDAGGGQPVVASLRVIADPKRPPSVFEISYRHLATVPSTSDSEVLERTQPFAAIRAGLPG
ncbi:MAG: hypothetical protein ACRD1T_20715, partial [Acidimicrobiia bacterium]